MRDLLSDNTKKIIKNEVQKTNFAVIRLPSIIGLEACKQCEKQDKPYLIEMVGDPFDALWNYGKISYKVIAPFYSLQNKIAIKKAKNVIYVTREYLQSRYPNEHDNIGISDVQLPKTNKEVIRKRVKRIKEYTIDTIYKIGLIGSLNVDFKGHDTAIKAIKILRDEYGKKVELYLLGQCSDKRKIYWQDIVKSSGVSNSIFFDGTLSGGEAVAKWLDNLDFYILPSLQEGLPRALLEAMSRGLVCLGAETGGIPELLDNDVIIKKKDARALAEKICELIETQEDMLRCATGNFNVALTYSPDVLEAERNKFYMNILSTVKENI